MKKHNKIHTFGFLLVGFILGFGLYVVGEAMTLTNPTNSGDSSSIDRKSSGETLTANQFNRILDLLNPFSVVNNNVGIGDPTPDTGLKLDVSGKIGANDYCDEAGENCIDGSDLASKTYVTNNSSGGDNTIINDNSILKTCKICTRYADYNGRASASWNCANFGSSSNTDFIGNVGSDDDFDMKITCTDTAINNNYQLCNKHADRNEGSTKPWKCVNFGQNLNTDFEGDVGRDDEFDVAIKTKDLNTVVLSNCGICNRYADYDGRASAGWRCSQIGHSLETNFIGGVGADDDFDFKLACNITLNN